MGFTLKDGWRAVFPKRKIRFWQAHGVGNCFFTIFQWLLANTVQNFALLLVGVDVYAKLYFLTIVLQPSCKNIQPCIISTIYSLAKIVI